MPVSDREHTGTKTRGKRRPRPARTLFLKAVLLTANFRHLLISEVGKTAWFMWTVRRWLHLTSAPLPPAPSLGVAIAFEEDDLWAGAAAAVVTILVTWQTHKHGPSPISRQIPFPTSIDSIQIRILDNRSPRLAFFEFGHQVAPLALVTNLGTGRRQMNYLQIWPPGSATCHWHYQLVSSSARVTKESPITIVKKFITFLSGYRIRQLRYCKVSSN